MTKLLPTLLPIIALIGAAVAPFAHTWLSTHALTALAVSTVVSVINHWIAPPTA